MVLCVNGSLFKYRAIKMHLPSLHFQNRQFKVGQQSKFKLCEELIGYHSFKLLYNKPQMRYSTLNTVYT